MKQNKTPIILYLFIGISFFSFSQKHTHIAFTIPADLKSDTNAVIRDSATEITIESVDEMIVYKREVVTVLNKLGDSDARIAESYDDNTKITKLSAIIYDAFGNEIKKYKERDFLDVSAVDNVSLYTDARVKYIRHTPVSYPYTLVFESEYKTNTTGFIPGWFPVNGYYVSVEKSNYTLKNPNAISWRKKETNFKGFNIEKSSSETEIKYELTNQKAFEFERSTIAAREILPMAKIALNQFNLDGVNGAFTNWNEFGKWMHQSLIEGRDQLDEDTKQKILELTKDAKSPLEKAKIVYQFMQDKTRYISVQIGIGGWQPIAANIVDEVGYGDCKGLTNYTKALLDVVGVTSYFTLVYANEKRNIDEEFSSLQGNHAILNIPNNGDDIWLECTSQTKPFGFLGDFTDDRNVLVITPEGGIIKRTAAYKNEINLQEITGEIELAKNGTAKAAIKRVSKGLQYDDKYYLEGFTDEELKKYYKSRVWDYNNNLEIENYTLNNNREEIVFTEDLTISLQNYASLNGKEYLFRVNVFNKENYVPKRYRKRTLPLQINRGYKDVDNYTFKIPINYTLTYLPEERVINSKFGSYTINFNKIDENTFSYQKIMIIREGTYPKEDYEAYRSFRKKVAKTENLRIALTKK